MSEFAGSVQIKVPVHQVWTFISDPENLRMWGRHVSEVAVTSQGPLVVGSTVRLRMSGQPLEARIIALVTEQMFALEFTSGPIKGSIVSYVLEAAEGGTRLTREFVLRLGGAWKLVYPLFRLREIRGREAGMANIKRLLESKARSPQPRPTQA